MRILIIDVTRDFGLFTPFEKPLGGLQSGLCYLARELSLQGHEITIANGCAEPHVEEGVRFLPWNIYWEGAADMDAIIVTAATGEMMSHWQRLYGHNPLWILWVHYDVDQHAIGLLANPPDRDCFDGFLFVSEWQAQVFREKFGVGWDRSFVLRNAVSPTFHKLFQPGEEILPAKSKDPVLVYTSTPYRGLAPLMDAVPLIREKVPDARFQIFSSWAVYGRSDAEDPHQELYNRCRTTPGVDYIGGVPQTELAQYLKQAWCVAYPSIFRETSCIAVMEGLASGCKVITSHLAALPETTYGFGSLVINPENDADLSRRFAEQAVRVIQDMRDNPVVMERELQASVTYARDYLTWSLRAAQLGEWLSARRAIYKRALESASTNASAASASVQQRVTRFSDRMQVVQARHGNFLTEAGTESLIGRTISGMGEWLESSVSLTLAALRPGDVVIDVGAHIGAMTVPFAKAVGQTGKVYAFEPQDRFFRQLEGNLALNDLPQVEPERALVGAGGTWIKGETLAQIPGQDPAWCRFLPAEDDQPGILAIRLDDRLADLDRCRLVKISAPGMAVNVLDGMEELMARTRPIILCEIATHADFLLMRDRLRAMGYLLHWNCADLFPADNAFQNSLGDLPPLAVLHLLALPQGSGLYSPLHPAMFDQDPAKLFNGRILAFRDSAFVPEKLSLPPKAPAVSDKIIEKWRDDPVLMAHLTYILAQGHGIADLPGHALWAELISARKPPDSGGIRMLALGDGAAPAAVLWTLLAKRWGLPMAVDVSRTQGFILQPDMDKLSMLVWIFALDREDFRLVDGKALPASNECYDVIYCRQEEDAAMVGPLLKGDGLLIVENGQSSDLKTVMTVERYKVFSPH
ncbi:MAG TPA: FkbM family methyltransferase [Candidatus Sulfotelmatobacter sp.]|jgi:FkbM family methyltransferase|nr:FkbM family methyltransferase [Candidatus Sulfotelmatobacter sp.]